MKLRCIKASQEQPQDQNVLEEHRRRNRPNRPPQLSRLEEAAAKQGTHSPLFLDDQDNLNEPEDFGGFSDAGQDLHDNDVAENGEEDNFEEVPKRRGRSCRFTDNPKPDTLQFYSGTWFEAIKTAKKRFRGYIFLKNGFPQRSTDLHEATAILSEVVEEYKDDGVLFNPGRCLRYFHKRK